MRLPNENAGELSPTGAETEAVATSKSPSTDAAIIAAIPQQIQSDGRFEIEVTRLQPIMLAVATASKKSSHVVWFTHTRIWVRLSVGANLFAVDFSLS